MRRREQEDEENTKMKNDGSRSWGEGKTSPLRRSLIGVSVPSNK